MEELFKERKEKLNIIKNLLRKPKEEKKATNNTSNIPEGLYTKCPECEQGFLSEDVQKNFYVCPGCGHHFKITATDRIQMLVDKDSFREITPRLKTQNVLGFPNYTQKLSHLEKTTGLNDAVVTGVAKVGGYRVVIGVMDSRFLMGSMGSVVGEKITRAIEYATKRRLPLLIFSASGGARMQEGIVSLMQMAKTSNALAKHNAAGLLYISYFTHPTTGGVTASFASLGDIMLAEPKALIGFAGPRVIEQTIKQKLPEGFQRSEFLLEHGFIDRIVERKEMRTVLENILQMHHTAQNPVIQKPVQTVEKERQSVQEKDAWERVTISRKNDRPVGQDYIRILFSDFLEFHGDRCYGDDTAIIGGIARFAGIPVTVIAQAKGKSTKENVAHHFGMPSPEGYRKALRLMKQAEKFKRPILLFVDTPGAFCGIEAEERGQGEAIARNLFEMSSMKVPILSVVIGEGGSGGALALAVADEVWMLENAIYSVLSPEGFASILWKDSKRASEAAAVMKLTAADLKKLGVIEAVIAEPEVYTEETMQSVVFVLQKKITEFLDTHCNFSPEELAAQRYERFRKM